MRKGARRLRLSTDASARFERGGDSSLPLVGAGRVAHLLETWAGAHHRGVGVAGDWRDPERTIALRPDRVSAYFHRPFSAAEIAERLAGYGFTTSGGPEELAVRVPPGRLWDVQNREDLYEELARNAGYDELPLALPAVAMGVQESPWERTKKRVEEVLLGLGFHEVMTNGFYSRQLAENLGIAEGHPLWDHVETANALDRSFSLLKNNAVAQAVEAAADNLRFGVDEIKMYEWTRTFHRNPAAANGVNDERELLWLIATGPSRDPSWADKPRRGRRLVSQGDRRGSGHRAADPLRGHPSRPRGAAPFGPAPLPPGHDPPGRPAGGDLRRARSHGGAGLRDQEGAPLLL